MRRTWTLEADVSAARLQTDVAEVAGYQHGVTGGQYASVSAVGDKRTAPDWMRQLATEYRGMGIDASID